MQTETKRIKNFVNGEHTDPADGQSYEADLLTWPAP